MRAIALPQKPHETDVLTYISKRGEGYHCSNSYLCKGLGKGAPSRADNVARGFGLGGNLLGLNVDRGVFHFNFVLVSHRFALR